MRKHKWVAAAALLLSFVIAGTVYANSYRPKFDFVLADSSALDIQSCRYTNPEPENPKLPNPLAELSEFQLKLENERLAVYFRKETGGLRIVNKSTGYVWGGLQNDDHENLNSKWSNMANSMVTIEYFDLLYNVRSASLGGSNTNFEFEWKENFADASVNLPNLEISFSFTLELFEDSLNFKLSQSSIKEGNDYKLRSVWFLPFLGAVEQDSVSGYMFIPDGSGALIRYSKSAQYVSAYNERIYGKDAAVDELSVAGDLMAKRNNDYLTDMPQITVPVYGAVHGAGRNGYFAVVNSGDEYASIYASPSGLVTDFNWVAARFDYRTLYNKPVNKSGSGISSTQAVPESFDCNISFYFLSGEAAGYTGMALKYRELLLENGTLPSAERVDEDIPLYLNVVAADVKKAFIGTKYVSLTSVSGLNNIVKNLQKQNISNLSVVYNGWQKGGINGYKYGNVKLDSRLGSIAEIDRLSEEISAGSGRLYMGINPVTINKNQARIASVASLKISKTFASLIRNNNELMYPEKYFISPGVVNDYLSFLTESHGNWQWGLSDAGKFIYGDYSREQIITRTQACQIFISMLGEQKNKPALNNPNSYLWSRTSEYLDLPVQNNQYLFETDSVPFLSILLKGNIDYYAPFANQGFYSTSSILRMIEYGAYPSFIVMDAANEKLIDTPQQDYFSLNFTEWESVIQKVYTTVNEALCKVEGQHIVNHQVLKQGVAAVTYDSGTVIYINYTDTNFPLSDETMVQAHNYYIREAA